VLLSRYSIDEGETMHGIRRGTMQQADEDGLPAEQIKKRAGITCDEVFDKYVDIGRHLP
jgi:hypothetical protein